MRDALRSEDGLSLIEILIAVVILASGSVSIMAALGTSVMSSGVHRSYATAETVTRDFTEAINTNANSTTTYNICPTAAQLTPSYTAPTNSGGTALYFATIAAPTGTKWSGDSPDAVQYWIPGTFPNGTWDNKAACEARVRAVCPENPDTYGTGANYKPPAACDPGLQRVWIRVRSNPAVLNNGVNDSQFVDQYSRILVRRYDAPAPS